jgi:phospholipase C
MTNRKTPNFNAGRRRFLAGVGAAGSLALTGCGPAATEAGPEAQARNAQLPDPEASGIDHIVQVMMENRSYDHMLGWVPKSNGIQNQVFTHTDGRDVETFHMGDSDPAYGFQGCGWEDPAHGYSDGRVHLNNGAMDGFLKTVGNTNDKFPAGYYNADDLLFYKGVAEHFTICDNYFHGILSSTFPNRMYIHAGATDRNTNTLPWAQQAPSTLPTIWDLLGAKGISCANYFSDLPLTGLWGEKYAAITKPFEQFLADASSGQLPAVSYFDPNFGFSVGESPAGVSRDDHPQADVRDGQVYLTEIYNALRASPNWERTLMIVTYDEWGGFYDHVEPPFGPVSPEEAAFNDGRLGFRTPCVILGPRAKRNHVSHLRFDPNSVINLIRWRFGLGALSARDTWSHNMALALDFKNAPNPAAPDFGQPSPGGLPANSRGAPWGAPCYNYLTNQLPLPADAPAGLRAWFEHQAELRPLYEMSKAAGLI